MNRAQDTAVILVNWRAFRDTIECLGALLLLNEGPASIVVVDNASNDESLDRLRAWCAGTSANSPESTGHGVRVLERAPPDLDWLECSEDDSPPARLPRVLLLTSRSNRGFAGGNNLGIRFATQEQISHYWLLNTDTVAAPDALDHLLRRAGERPEAGMVGSTLIYYWRPRCVQALGGASFDPVSGIARHLGESEPVSAIPVDPKELEGRLDYIVGASMLVTRTFVEQVGAMCEDYFLYFEEIDWALRARGRFVLAYAPASIVYHKVGSSSVKQASRASLRYLYRNRLRIVARFFPRSRKTAILHMMLQTFQHLRRRHWGNVRELLAALANARRLFAVEARR